MKEYQVYELSQGAFDVLTLCSQEDRPHDAEVTWFVVEPSYMYPAMITRIQQALQDKEAVPAELIDTHGNEEIDSRSAARQHMRDAKAVAQEGWQLCDAENSDMLADGQRKMRAQALEVARRWFTRALKNRVDGPIGLHILNDPKYRL